MERGRVSRAGKLSTDLTEKRETNGLRAARHRKTSSKHPAFDCELTHLSADERWREFVVRIEAVLFASATPVSRAALARVVGQGMVLEHLLDDLADDLKGRPYDLRQVAGGWILQTKPAYASAIHIAADVGEGALDLRDPDVVVLAAIAWHQPITRSGLTDIFGKAPARETIARLRAKHLIAAGPRSPDRGAPKTYVTTDEFLLEFGLNTLDDLPDHNETTDLI